MKDIKPLGNRSSPLPMLMIMGCALPAMLAGLTLSEISDSRGIFWFDPLWVPLITGGAIGIALAIVFSPRYKFSFARPFERVLAGSAIRMIAAGSALGLTVTVLSLLICIATSVWSFDWTTWWICIGASPIYGALAGLGVINMDIGENAR